MSNQFHLNIDVILTLIYYCMPLATSVIFLYYTFYYLKAARSIEDTPTSRIRSAAQGFVEINGTAKSLLHEPTLGRLTKTACGWYHYTIEKYTYRVIEKTATYSWELLEQGTSNEPFLLTDGTGECAVLPEGATVTPTRLISWRDHTPNPGPPPTSFWLWLLWNSWGPYRFTEYRLELDTPIYTTGMFHTLDKGQLHEKNPELEMYLNETNASLVHVLCKEGLSQNQNFLISGVPEKTLIRRYKIKAFAFFLSFLFFIAMTVNSAFPNVRETLQQWQYKNGWRLNF